MYFGFPDENIESIPKGEYYVQAVLHKYQTFNLASKPFKIIFDPTNHNIIKIILSEVNPNIYEPKDTEYIRHIKIRSQLLTEFLGTDIFSSTCISTSWL